MIVLKAYGTGGLINWHNGELLMRKTLDLICCTYTPRSDTSTHRKKRREEKTWKIESRLRHNKNEEKKEKTEREKERKKR